MPKFKLLRDALVRDGVISEAQLYQPGTPPQDWLEWVHTPSYVQAYCQGGLDERAQRRIGLPWSPALVKRTCTAVGGTILTAKLALQHGLACNTAGGTHHAFPDYGSGFCIFNDLAIATRVLQRQGLIQKLLIVDLDVHQGDGTAWIFQSEPSVFTFSMHCAVNFPGRKQISDLDIPLAEGTEDDAYLSTLQQHLPDVLSHVRPDLVLYDAGA
ncbi:MAG: histone deacetylase, partial [Cyanobacteria bacterium J06635_1]